MFSPLIARCKKNPPPKVGVTRLRYRGRGVFLWGIQGSRSPQECCDVWGSEAEKTCGGSWERNRVLMCQVIVRGTTGKNNSRVSLQKCLVAKKMQLWIESRAGFFPSSIYGFSFFFQGKWCVCVYRVELFGGSFQNFFWSIRGAFFSFVRKEKFPLLLFSVTGGVFKRALALTAVSHTR